MTPEMSKLIDLLRSELGYTEGSGGYTKFGEWYNSVEHDSNYSNQPWCDMFLSWGAHKLGYDEWFGQFSYTVDHAKWFKEQGAWGTKPSPGAIVFYDWSGGHSVDGIDHVGIVTSVAGNTIHTIEGNVDGRFVHEKVRDQRSVVGYGYPEKILKRVGDQEASVTLLAKKTANTTDALISVTPDTDSPTAEATAKATDEATAQPIDQPAEPAKPAAQPVAKAAAKTVARAAAPKAVVTHAKPAVKAITAKHVTTTATTTLATVPMASVQQLPIGGLPSLGAQALITPALLAALAIAYVKSRRTHLRPALAAAGTRMTARRRERPAPAPIPATTSSTYVGKRRKTATVAQTRGRHRRR
ncbi:CHAP domain-containing protein [Streptosporangiaceae bacterium NEAU-GS5]|nr:CHAP domain-containing protein [Streptosporangiaceae bacterium NEAU-GS5]